MSLSMCIVGCGGYARPVLNDIRNLDGLELFFASRTLEKASAYAEEYGGSGAFGSYEDAAADPRVEAMYFLTPHHVHLDHARLAARHSKHVLMEKPIARTLPEGREMIAAAGEAGVRLMVAENHRFLPTVRRCRALIDEGAIGAIRVVHIQAEVYDLPTGWRTDLEMVGGGVIIDGGIHYVDELVTLGGFPTRVYAATPPPLLPEAEGEDGMILTAHLPGGALGLIHVSNATPSGERLVRTTVTGTTGRISFDPFGQEVVLETAEEKRVLDLPRGGRGVREMVQEFMACLREDREPAMSGEDGLRDLEIVLAAYRSANEGAEVALTSP